MPFGATGPGAPYAGLSNLEALLTVSQDNAALLRHAFPEIPVHIARVVVDERGFAMDDIVDLKVRGVVA